MPSYYRGANRPAAVVLHVMQGHMSTVLSWARDGYPYVSWHFSVDRDGQVYQHLDLVDGGYHAGITDAQAQKYPPRWPLWKGRGINVNHYTIGIEHEGFAGEPFTNEQSEASRDLCQWIVDELGIPFDSIGFPPHADIDTVNRVNDFNTPALREAHYRYLFEEDSMELEELRERVRQLELYIGAFVDPHVRAGGSIQRLREGYHDLGKPTDPHAALLDGLDKHKHEA